MSENKAKYRWENDSLRESLEALQADTVASVQDNIEWYRNASRKKKRWAQNIRRFALVLLGVGTIIPIIIDLGDNLGYFSIPASVASLVLALGTGLVAYDRLMGFSTGWMSFITSELSMKAKLRAFEYEWQLQQIALGGAPPTFEQTSQFANLCFTLRKEIDAMVQEETQRWVEEFQNNLKALDEKYKSLAEAARFGAISLTVENGADFAEGWSVFVDNHSKGKQHGSTAALSHLTPGLRTVVVTAKGEDSKAVTASAVVTVDPGQITGLNLTLE